MTPQTLTQLEAIARLVRAIGVGDDAAASVRAASQLECKMAGEPYRRVARFADGAARMLTVCVSPTTHPGVYFVTSTGELRDTVGPVEL